MEELQEIINGFDLEKIARFFRSKNRRFRNIEEDYSQYNDQIFQDVYKLGYIEFEETGDKLFIIATSINKELTEKTSKKSQYDKGRQIIRQTQCDAGIFIFYDGNGNFRFSLIYPQYLGKTKKFNNFKRFTYFVNKNFNNKTFLQQIGNGDFTTLENVKAAFSLAQVTKVFYNDFLPIFNSLAASVCSTQNDVISEKEKNDFTLLFVIRIIFLGFLQKRKWLGEDKDFLQNFYKKYNEKYSDENKFYSKWLKLLFFEALNTPYGHKVAYKNNDFDETLEKHLQLAPYIDGGLFHEKDIDKKYLYIPDSEIEKYFDFLFSYNFTVEENTLYDEELELNPEFLGIIFEKLVQRENGAVYTQRVEVDMMCRLSLVKWLAKNNTTSIDIKALYELFFVEGGKGIEYEDQQKWGNFSELQYKNLLNLAEEITICDPAVGSGAFVVGMVQVLDELIEHLRDKIGKKDKNAYERRKKIISKSLYGVEVKEWAVWITQLRLWITLFIDAPDDLRQSLEPILPSLDFKIRQGDSLVQLVGSKAFPITGHAYISSSTKRKITELKNIKVDYYNHTPTAPDKQLITLKESQIYRDILDEEIQGYRQDLRSIKNIQDKKQVTIFTNTGAEAEQETLDFSKNKVEVIEEKIKELEEQQNSMQKNKPLVWSIEFAEIFIEKQGFDIIIGNPPYIRQEKIEDPTGRIKDKQEYKNKLKEMVQMDFPDYFKPKVKINAQSDLYTYFYIRGLKLLNPNGILTFICSNSWLDVGYGAWLQKFLLDRAPIDFIIDNHAKRSFAEADVNTIVSIINAPTKKSDKKHLIKFVAYKKPFDQVIFTENLLTIENAGLVQKDENLRVYPISNEDLLISGTEFENKEQEKAKMGKYIGDKWGGKYLRAPDIFFTILEKGKDKLVKLGDIADVKFGIKTGCNEFFYLAEEQIKEWKIEPEFLKPVIKSPRECKTILVDPSKLKYKIFLCNKSKQELKGTNALKYIEWGEKQKTKDGIFWKDVPSVTGRALWYSLGAREPAHINFNYLINDFGTSFIGNCFVSDNFHEIHTLKQIDLFLNSTVFWLFQNLFGRVSFGGGLLKIQTYELKQILTLETKNIQPAKLNNHIRTIFKECGLQPNIDKPLLEQEPEPIPDRAELDAIVFNALNLTEEERKDVYRAVCQLVWDRISRAGNV
jgi:hypothetical protein